MTKLKNVLLSSSLCLALTLTFPSYSDSTVPAFKSPLASKRLLTEITQVENQLVAIGERGHIIKSKDGQNWTQSDVPVSVLLTSISFSDSSKGFATGHDSVILKSESGGENWQLVNHQPELDRPLLAVQAYDNYVVAVGAYGSYWQSNDGGKTWTSEFHDELLFAEDRDYLNELKAVNPESYKNEQMYLLPHFNDVLLTESAWFMAGEAGFLAKSVDKGQTWEKLPINYFGSLFGIAAKQNSNLVIAGLRGNLFTEQSKSQLSAQKLPGNATINDVLITGNHMFLFANSGNLYYSLNNGPVKHYIFDDGKAVMSGVVFNENLILATEAGIKSMPVSTFK